MATTYTTDNDNVQLGRIALGLKALHFAGLFLLGMLLLPAVPLLGRYNKYLVNWWLGRILAALDVKIDIDGEIPNEAMLVVATHCSWLDILVLGRVFDSAFVSKAEVASWPVVSWFARAGGTVFLSRGAGRTGETSAAIRAVLGSGRSVLFFPEGTTTPEPTPQRFHARLFAAAIDGHYPVLPINLRYTGNCTPPDQHHALVPWIDAPLWPHFRALFKLREVRAEVRICAPIDPRGYDRRSLAEASHKAVAHRQAMAATHGFRSRPAPYHD
jgi:1-acyl-sn-glycerol-3-phosphate acyltransferase